jgi:hypothetical protein
VRLTFDRGTVVLTQDGDPLDLATVPGVLWDTRVGVHRVPPYRCAALVAELRTKSVQVTDETTAYVRAPDEAFSGPELRDYQETALQLWHAAGCRGAIVLPTGSGKTSVAVGAMGDLGCRRSASCRRESSFISGVRRWHNTTAGL